MTPRLRAALAGAAGAGVWAALEPVDRRLFRCEYSDVHLVGLPVHLANGVLFGLAFHEARRRLPVRPRRLALLMALAEHVSLWPLLGLIEPEMARSPRAFTQGAARHALFGLVLGRLA